MKTKRSSFRLLAAALAVLMAVALLPAPAARAAGETAKIYVTLSDTSGDFAKSRKTGETMLLAPVTVSDLDGDGKLTVDEALTAFHTAYSAGGAADYACSGGFITKLWGVTTSSVGYYHNDAYVSTSAAVETVAAGDTIKAYFYQDTVNWSDLYTWFGRTSLTAAGAGQATAFTLLGTSWSGATAPAGAAVRVFDASGAELPALAAKTDKDGSFSVVFPAAGTYTVKAVSDPSNGVYIVPSACTVTVPDASAVFGDVAYTAWYYDAVCYAAEHKLFDGVGGGSFSPGGTMTRAMLATVLWRLDGKPAAAGGDGFTDTRKDAWYAGAVAWAAENGIVDGYGGGLFGPDDSVTREQLAAILLHYAALKKYDTSASGDLSAYTDAASVSPYALPAMKWANAAGLVTGRTASELAAGGTATRAEVAAVLMRFCGTVAK